MKEKKMKDEKILELIAPTVEATVNHMESISKLRTNDTSVLRGSPYPGDDVRKKMGHSTTISKVVANTVNWTQPGLVEIFSGDFYRFDFSNPGFAADLKDLVDKIWFRRQDGEKTNDTFLYDCQTNRLGGIVKTYHYKELDLETEEFKRMDEQQFQELQDDEKVKISRFDKVSETVNGVPAIFYDNVKTVKQVTVFEGPKIENVPPECFGISPECKGNLKKARLVYDWSVRNVDYVRRMERAGIFKKGSTDKLLNQYKGDGDLEGAAAATETERENRFWVEGTEAPQIAMTQGTLNSDDPTLQPANDFKMYQIYTKLDIDGDGLLEPVIITTSGNIVFKVEENKYGSPPFVIGRPFMISHQLQQQTYAEMLAEDQKVMTNLIRMMQDAAARTTYSNLITSDKLTFDQLKNRKPNSVIYGDPEKVKDIPVRDPSQYVLKAIEMQQGDIENSAGVTRYNQGLDANSLNKTYGGMQLIMTASQKRQRLTARRIGWAFRDIIHNIIKILELDPTPDFLDLLRRHKVISGNITIDDIIIDVGVSFEEKFAMSQQLAGLGQWHIDVGIPAGITTKQELLTTVRKQYALLNINTEGILPDDEEFERRTATQEQGQTPNGGQVETTIGQQQTVEQGQQQLVG